MKVVGWIIGVLVVVAAAVVAFLALNSGGLIKTAIESLGPDYLGAPVKVDSVDLSLTEGSAQVKGLNIGNPAGFEGAHAMKLGEVKVTLDAGQISDTLVVMKQVLIDGADVAAIASGKRTNFQQLMDNVTRAAGSGESAPAQDASTSEMKFIIEKFDFTNARASLSSDVLGDMQLSIPDIHLTDIGRKSNGATALELTREIMKPITSAISKSVVAQGLDLEGVKARATSEIKEKLGEQLGDKLGGLKGLLNK